jgi:hypothetical protein
MLRDRARRHSAGRTESVSASAWAFGATFHVRQNVIPRWNRVGIFVVLHRPGLGGAVNLASLSGLGK